MTTTYIMLLVRREDMSILKNFCEKGYWTVQIQPRSTLCEIQPVVVEDINICNAAQKAENILELIKLEREDLSKLKEEITSSQHTQMFFFFKIRHRHWLYSNGQPSNRTT
jgi:tRNA A37 N6-isopentenylltransferase MiaA